MALAPQSSLYSCEIGHVAFVEREHLKAFEKWEHLKTFPAVSGLGCSDQALLVFGVLGPVALTQSLRRLVFVVQAQAASQNGRLQGMQVFVVKELF